MRYTEKDEAGDIVLQLDLDEIPAYLSDHPDDALLRRLYEIEQEKATYTPPDCPDYDVEQCRLSRQIFPEMKRDWWNDLANIEFLRRQGLINVNKSKDLPEEYYGLALVPASFLDKIEPGVEIVACSWPVVNGAAIYKRIVVRRSCSEIPPPLYDTSGFEHPDNENAVLEYIIEHHGESGLLLREKLFRAST